MRVCVCVVCGARKTRIARESRQHVFAGSFCAHEKVHGMHGRPHRYRPLQHRMAKKLGSRTRTWMRCERRALVRLHSFRNIEWDVELVLHIIKRIANEMRNAAHVGERCMCVVRALIYLAEFKCSGNGE